MRWFNLGTFILVLIHLANYKRFVFSRTLHNDEINQVLLKGFMEEKSKSRRLEETLKQVVNDISGMSTNMSVLEHKLIRMANDTENLRHTVLTLQTSHKKSLMQEPTFVSEWILMRAQDPDFVERTVTHGLGTVPYKVDVQIRPTSGPNAGWIFSGDSAIQSDDDSYAQVYGGVVYFYDEMNVYLMTPMKANGHASGVLINTGENKNLHLGNNHQTSMEAYVRVKVWSPSDFPEPDMKSDWLPLDITNKSRTYYEITHGLNDYPGLTNVQIRCNLPDDKIIISEGQGASAMHRQYSDAGGVVHAFNENVVRIWAGYLGNKTSANHFRLLGMLDGWNHAALRSIRSCIKGHVRVLAWNRLNITGSGTEFEHHEENKEFAEWSVFKKFSPNADLVSFYVQANDGLNKGFRFPGYGNSQSQNLPFGGAVYAYNANGDIRIWRPNPSANGYLIHVRAPYGNGINVQASNNAHYVASLLRSN